MMNHIDRKTCRWLVVEFLPRICLPACLMFAFAAVEVSRLTAAEFAARERLLIDDDWRFTYNDPPNNTVSLLYDVRPVRGAAQGAAADGAANEAPPQVVKAWILPSGNAFLKDPAHGAKRPDGNLGEGVAYIAPEFDDRDWRKVNLPHDYAIEGPFSRAGGGGMGRLPSAAVVWYRKHLDIPAADAGKSIFLDIDGAMSYSEVWLNGRFVGGWPFGYASFRLRSHALCETRRGKRAGHSAR